MNEFLFIFTISPVQSFIAQARKTQDLKAGSSILTDLIGHAIDVLKKDQSVKAEIIFPDESSMNKPNRFVAKITCDDETKMKDVGQKIESSTKEKFLITAQKLLIETTNSSTSNFKKIFDKQIEDFLIINWLALPLDGGKYPETYEELESTLGSLKNGRFFEQLKETGRKCSLCGERNALLFNASMKDSERDYTGNFRKRYFDLNSVNVYGNNNFKIQNGEGLCAVCFTKRFYLNEEFSSTAEIALMETYKVLSEKKGDFVNDYKVLFGKDFDFQLLFEENLTNNYFNKQSVAINDDKGQNRIDVAKKEIAKLKKCDTIRGIKFTPYYSVVMFDGDSMGEWLSGKHLNDRNGLEKFHSKLSESIAGYATYVEKLIRNPIGCTLYAGGEDFLGFVNLNHLFCTLKELRTEFKSKISDQIRFFLNEASPELTFSAGIVIAGYKDPLSEVLKEARKSERFAKEYDEQTKNAFSITVLKNSGEYVQCRFPWQSKVDENDVWTLDLMNNLVSSLLNDVFSNSFIKSIESEFLRLLNVDDKIQERQMLDSEIQRMVKNSCKLKKNLGERDKDYTTRKNNAIKELSDSLIQLLKSSLTARNFFNAMNICEFISRHLNNEGGITK